MKKKISEQASPIGSGYSMLPAWWSEFGCIMEGVDGLKKVTTETGTAFEHTPTKTILFNPSFQKPNDELVNKIKTVNPNIKVFGKSYNYVTKEEGVFYCKGKFRGGITIIGKNDTVPPPAVKTPAPAANTPAQPSKAPAAPAATVNEQFESKVLSEQLIRIKDMMGKLL